MHTEHAQVAARHTLCLLKWVASRNPIHTEELRAYFDSIYDDGFSPIQRSKLISSHAQQKEIIFEDVRLAFNHFVGLNPTLDDIKQFLTAESENDCIAAAAELIHLRK